MVDFLDSWVHIIPVWILENILDQLIFPKLQKEVGPGPGARELGERGDSLRTSLPPSAAETPAVTELVGTAIALC